VGTGAQVGKLKVPVVVTVAGVVLVCSEVVPLLGVQIDSGLTMVKFFNSKVSAMNNTSEH